MEDKLKTEVENRVKAIFKELYAFCDFIEGQEKDFFSTGIEQRLFKAQGLIGIATMQLGIIVADPVQKPALLAQMIEARNLIELSENRGNRDYPN